MTLDKDTAELEQDSHQARMLAEMTRQTKELAAIKSVLYLLVMLILVSVLLGVVLASG